MIKDATLKLFFIPLTGILIPVLSGLFHLRNFSLIEDILSTLLFILVSLFIWQGTITLVSYIRNTACAKKGLAHSILMLIFSVACFAAVLSSSFSLLWQKIFTGTLNNRATFTYSLSYSLTALFIGMIYEVLFLKKELELDTKIVNQLDLERQYAEMNVLKNELDPHFIFNSLTTLSHLVGNDCQKADLFVNKLAQAYKYLLINKDRELITLEEELRFIADYFYLLRIRHDDKLKMKIRIDHKEDEQLMILPCALQILVENAIKHNYFTEEDPLVIEIYLNKSYLYVVNNIHSKPYLVDSTHIGLRNLSSRYRLTCQKDIVIHDLKDKFLVKLPIIKPNGI